MVCFLDRVREYTVQIIFYLTDTITYGSWKFYLEEKILTKNLHLLSCRIQAQNNQADMDKPDQAADSTSS